MPHRLCLTAYASPQLELWELDDEQWRKIFELPLRPRRRARTPDAGGVQQLLLPTLALVLALVAAGPASLGGTGPSAGNSTTPVNPVPGQVMG
jgi:hypothetical protein